MSTNFEDLGLFHTKFHLGVVDDRHPPGPREVPKELLEFRRGFLLEELEEFFMASHNDDIVEMADALVDLVYVVLGTAHMLGLPWQELWDEVQRSNMAKVRAKADGSDSKRGTAFDVIKPPGWTPPDLRSILIKYGFNTQSRKTLNY